MIINMQHKFTAVILDMDGLLLDTEPIYKKAWQQGAQALGYKLSNQLCDQFSGNSLQAIEQRLKQLFGEQFDFDRFMRLSTDYWYQMIATQSVQPMPGAMLLIKKLQDNNIAYALATNSPADIANYCLKHADLENQFPVRVTSDEVAHSKPAPDIYQLAMHKLNTSPHQCLCVEDSWPGIQAAHDAGGVTVMISAQAQSNQAVEQVFRHNQSFADYQFSSLEDLLEYC
jgi:HAD superfamily hydrolase (TIGR01509 family)